MPNAGALLSTTRRWTPVFQLKEDSPSEDITRGALRVSILYDGSLLVLTRLRSFALVRSHSSTPPYTHESRQTTP